MDSTIRQGSNLTETSSYKQIMNRFEYIVNKLKNQKGTLIDVGAGEGYFGKIIKEYNKDLITTAIDIDDFFNNKLIESYDNVIFDDFTKYDFKEKFDFIVSTEVIEHILNTDDFLIKAKSILKENGTFYLIAPNLASWHGRLSLLFGYLPELVELSNYKGYYGKFGIFRSEALNHVVGHIRPFCNKALFEMVEDYGFKVVDAAGIDLRMPALFRHLPSIAGSVCVTLSHK